jgi:hypothetical protein
MTKVFMMEYERGWGSRLDETKEFLTRKEAEEFANDYNKKHNNKATVPDWYIVAVVEEPT